MYRSDITPSATSPCQTVADRLNIHPVEVYSVVTFYAFLSEKQHGRFVIPALSYGELRHEGEGRGGSTAEERSRYRIRRGPRPTGVSRWSGPTASACATRDQRYSVNDQVFTHVTPEKVRDILTACEKGVWPPYAAERRGARTMTICNKMTLPRSRPARGSARRWAWIRTA